MTLAKDFVDRLLSYVWKSGPFAKKTDRFDGQEIANLMAALESAGN
jgi:hypothetical protein